MPTSISDYHSLFYSKGHSVAEVFADLLDRVCSEDPALWIYRFPSDVVLNRAAELDTRGCEGLPLFGVPFAVKDNIDIAGIPTTAGCPEFAYVPTSTAPVVQALLDAGAVCLGKTNLDQFATGLVGVRSPYGVPANPFDAAFIPGGSSSGSAVAVSRNLAAFALGTDTAGSGRVPAAFNDLFGWKPTRGLLSTTGIVPACRSLDCVSVFARTADDLQTIRRVVARFDAADPFSRRDPGLKARPVRVIGIPRTEQLEFFGDDEQCACWEASVEDFRDRGFVVREIDFAPMFAAARLLYEGPWVAERFLVVQDLLTRNPSALHTVTRTILEKGSLPTAADAFAAQYRLAELTRLAEPVWEQADILCTPTTGTIYRQAEIAEDPFTLNSNLGYYTNFVNLLDLSALAIPAGFRSDGLPFGITLLAPAFQDRTLLTFAASGRDTGIFPETNQPSSIELAVCGAHMRGLPLNGQLLALEAQFLREDATTPEYRMYALDEKRPGLLRVTEGGSSLPLEVWRLPTARLGELLAVIPSPLGLGRIHLASGSDACGFLCESAATHGIPDITDKGGWRSHLGC